MDKLSFLPVGISLVFILTTFATLLLFFWVLRDSTLESTRKNSPKIVLALVAWLILQFFMTWKGIYSDFPDALPPKIALFGIIPTFIIMIFLFVSARGRLFIDSLPLKQITYLNIVRIPVEIVLFLLVVYNTIPTEMSFEGWNFDILAGITAPFIAYFGLTKGKISRKAILAWNVISLLLLLTIIVVAMLSAPSSFQMIPFDEKVFAIFEFPFSWLPTFVVPVVLFGHFVSIRRLTRSN